VLTLPRETVLLFIHPSMYDFLTLIDVTVAGGFPRRVELELRYLPSVSQCGIAQRVRGYSSAPFQIQDRGARAYSSTHCQ
jgi:hypothetical protein